MKLVESDCRFSDDERTFRWVKGDKVVATITMYADGLLEFSTDRSGDIAVERIGCPDESVLIDQLEIRVGRVEPKIG